MHTWLQKLVLFNFKNYTDASLSFCDKINCLTGNNGTGKTNILDAIHYLSLCKSYFTNIDSQNIRYHEEIFTIQGEYFVNDKIENIFCGLKSGQKKIFKRNNKEYDRLAEHIGLIPVVIVSPSDSAIILEGSEERRRFIDTVLSQYNINYLEDLMRYNRALLQRNMLLKDFDQKNWFDPDMLAMWDEQLIETGNRIFEKRKLFISDITPVFQHYYEFVSGGAEKVQLIYESQLENNDYSELLSQAQTKDRKVLYTTQGIHKDDLVLNLENHPIKRVGSQGQQKTYIVALKLAQFEFIKKQSGKYPLLLLDDIFDKFDSDRVNKIIQLVSNNDFGQIFITDTSYERMHNILTQIGTDFRLFNISSEGITH